MLSRFAGSLLYFNSRDDKAKRIQTELTILLIPANATFCSSIPTSTPPPPLAAPPLGGRGEAVGRWDTPAAAEGSIGAGANGSG
jgi:hypothetical protein